MIGLPAKRSTDATLAEAVVPLLCVLLCLVALLLVRIAAAGASHEALAAAAGRDPRSPRALQVDVLASGSIQLRGRKVELSSVRQLVSEARFAEPLAPVVVSAEGGARASLVVRVVDECRRSGAADVRLSLTQEAQSHADDTSKP